MLTSRLARGVPAKRIIECGAFPPSDLPRPEVPGELGKSGAWETSGKDDTDIRLEPSGRAEAFAKCSIMKCDCRGALLRPDDFSYNR